MLKIPQERFAFVGFRLLLLFLKFLRSGFLRKIVYFEQPSTILVKTVWYITIFLWFFCTKKDR